MVSPTLKKYKKLISEMPLSEHSSTSEKRTWEEKEGKKGCKDIVESLFGEKKSFTVSREDVFRYAKQAKKNETNSAWKKFICATLVWGWPAGNRGYIKSMVNEDIGRLVKHFKSISPKITFEEFKTKYRKRDITGLGLSAYTKFLYFLEISIDGKPALILDKKLIEVFKREVFQDFNVLKGIRYDNAIKEYYTIYLEQMHKLGKELELGPRGAEKLEMFLFILGSNLNI